MFLCYITRNGGEKYVYFSSFRGQYSDNPKAISESLHIIAPEIKQIWCLSMASMNDAPDYITKVRLGSLQAIKLQARASVWVDNCVYRKFTGVYKGKDTFYIQTWHGDRGVKRVGFLALETMGKKYREYGNPIEMKDCNLYLAASDFGVTLANKGLRFFGEIMKEGSPRNDILINRVNNKQKALTIKKKLGIRMTDKILLYAPTFRDNSSVQTCLVNLEESLKCLNKKDENWICLVRTHSLTKKMDFAQFTNCYIDVTSYPDMADLLLITDLLITDYSSCATD